MAASEDFYEKFNAAATKELVDDAASSRQKFLQFTGIAIRELLESQTFAADFAEHGDTVEFKVTRDPIGVISEPTDGKIDLLGFMLAGKNVFQNTDERLKLMVPVPRDFDHEDEYQIETLPTPTVVYTERSLAPKASGEIGRVLSRYAVAIGRSYSFEQTDTDITEVLSDRDIDQLLHPQVPDELTRIVRLRLDLVRFTAAVQRQITIGQGEIQDF